MTSAENSVTKEGMEAAAARMEQALRTVNSEKEQVDASVSRLFGTFTGDAATTYRMAMKGWYDNVDTINQALNEMINIMRQGAQTVGTTAANTHAEAEEGLRLMNSTAATGLSGL
ncbi:hypothetical protein GCM10022267_87740 [Lentzea roselyniae]|uniref:WXG100 family type VII secretion target n=1 Tax=Lentzea roselyniae TaxID=531940 RepID=A0ABP7CFM4_9PSEU